MNVAGPQPPVGAAGVDATSRALAVFANRPFLLLWLSQASTQIGGNMVLYGLTVIMYSATRSSSAVSLLLLTFLVPAVAFSAVAGVYVDRFDRRLVLIVTNVLRGAAFIVLFLVGNNVALIFVLNATVSTITTFFAPAEAAMIPFLVPRGQLTAANGIFTLTMNVAFAVGFALLGPLVVTVAGPAALLLLVSAFYLAAAVFCFTLPAEPPPETVRAGAGQGGLHGLASGLAVAEAEAAVGSTLAQLREGIDYIVDHRSIGWSLTYLGITASLIGVLGALGPDFATKSLGLAPKDFVVVVLPLGLGVVTGILMLNSYGRYLPRRRVIEGGLITLGVLLALLSIAGPLTQFLQRRLTAAGGLTDVGSIVSLLSVVVGLAFLAGVSYAVVAIPSQTQLQEDLPEEVRGRVFGILNMLLSIASFLPIIVAGFLATLVGPTSVIFSVALLIGFAGLASVLGRGPLNASEAMATAEASASAPVDAATVAFSGGDRQRVALRAEAAGQQTGGDLTAETAVGVAASSGPAGATDEEWGGSDAGLVSGTAPAATRGRRSGRPAPRVEAGVRSLWDAAQPDDPAEGGAGGSSASGEGGPPADRGDD
ncbi:MAG: MFS transporter [Candidatus Limnocylindrales bacterium]